MIHKNKRNMESISKSIVTSTTYQLASYCTHQRTSRTCTSRQKLTSHSNVLSLLTSYQQLVAGYGSSKNTTHHVLQLTKSRGSSNTVRQYAGISFQLVGWNHSSRHTHTQRERETNATYTCDVGANIVLQQIMLVFIL